MNTDSHYPRLPETYSEAWEREMVANRAFAPAAHALLEERRVNEALRLCSAGVAAHPFYATGHLLLGSIHMAEERWEEARLSLERALQLDGTSPALLETLARCYDELELADIANDCRALGRDLDLRPLTDEENKGGPEMVEERANDREPGGEEEQGPEEPREDFPTGGDLGSPEDALKELETLLEGAGPSLEGAEEQALEQPLPVDEGTEEVAEPAVAAEADDESKEDMWKKIMEQADAVTETGYEGVEKPEGLVGLPEGGEEAEEGAVEVEEEVEVGVGVELEAGAGEAVEVESEELVAGPLELSEQVIEDVSKGLELDDSFEISPVAEEAVPAPSEAEEPVEIAATEIEAETGVEEALRALEGEQDLNSELDALKADAEEPDMDTVEETGLEELAIEEEVEKVGAGAGEEEVLSTLKEDLVSGGAPSESGTIQINDAEDAIKIAIQAEIVATKGHTKEAIRLFEALHLWEPERASYKERLDELRRI